MLYLTIIGGVFITWLVIAILFTPHIPYHIQSAVDARGDHFVHVLESTCQTHMERGNRARDVGHSEHEATTIRFGDGLCGQDLLLLNLVAIHQAGP